MIQTGTFWLVLFGSVAVHWLLPQRARLWFLAAVSLAYITYLDLVAGLSVAVWSVVVFYCAPRFDRSRGDKRLPKGLRIVSNSLILLVLAYLSYFKVVPYLMERHAADGMPAAFIIPLGVSYFTFKMVHYIIEAARGNPHCGSPSHFFAYVFLFPIFTAGPIERIDHFVTNQEKQLSAEALLDGATRMVHGLIKIFVLGEMVIMPLFHGTTVSDLLFKLEAMPPHKVWGFLILSFLYGYLDFSAYSDLAIGASRMFGLRIMENFRWPILAGSIVQFWQRWHMSLVNWCQSYAYMPLLGRFRNVYLAIYGTFFVMGMWHGFSFNWLGWGLFHGSGLVFYHHWSRWKRKRMNVTSRFLGVLGRVAGTGLTFLFVTVSGAFVVCHDSGGIRGTFRILLKLIGIDV